LLAGNGNDQTECLSRLPVFFAKLDQHILLIGGNPVGDAMYFTLGIGKPFFSALRGNE
jgi:hypothetical protein